MSKLSDEDIKRLLRDLPNVPVSNDFTEKVLRRLDEPPKARGLRSPRLALAGLAAIVVIGVAASGISLKALRARYERSRAAERVEALREEYRTLQTELDKLRRLTDELEPVIDLGGTEDVDFVFDMRQLARDEGKGAKAEPVSHSPAEPQGTGERKP
jgi:hypothetical protein